MWNTRFVLNVVFIYLKRPEARVQTLSIFHPRMISKSGCCLLLSILCFFVWPVPASAHIRIDTPEGGATLVKGSVFTVQWDAYIYHGPGTVSLEFSANNGLAFSEITSGIPIETADETVGTFDWLVPEINSATCRIRAIYETDSLFSSRYTFTTQPFTIGTPNAQEDPDEEQQIGRYYISISPSKDTTLYEDSEGAISNGAGSHLFVGKTGMNLTRRSLIVFDLASVVPLSATVVRSELTLNVSMAASEEGTMVSLIPMLADWGEGVSDALGAEGGGALSELDDATWIHSYYPDLFWANAGGDFSSGLGSSAEIFGPGLYRFPSTTEMVDFAQQALDSPETNFGWIVIGDESKSRTAKRFDSRENPEPAYQPTLRIEFDHDEHFEELGVIIRDSEDEIVLGESRVDLMAPIGSSHQWFRDGQRIVDGADLIRQISGADSTVLILDPFTEADSGEYQCVYVPEGQEDFGLVETAVLNLRESGGDEFRDGDSGNCFIATAAFGTPLAQEIDILRKIRDDHLLGNVAGMVAVDSYYRVSPPIADFLSRNAFPRTVVRVLITTLIWGFSLFSHGSGFGAVLLAFAGCGLLHRWRHRISLLSD